MKINSPNEHELVLFTNPQSRGAIVVWMLEEIGAPYETKVLSYGADMHSEEYLQLNPMGKVPCLLHKKQVVTECAAICAYLADAFPESQLAPQTSERASYYRWLFFASGPLEAAVTNKALGVEVPADKRGFVGYGDFDSVIHTLTKAVSQNNYIAGEKFTAADVYVGSQIGWGLKFGSIPQRAEFQDYWARLSTREAYIRSVEKNAALQG